VADEPDRDARLAAAAAHVADALTVALAEAGWTATCRPGGPLAMTRGEHMLLPGPLVKALAHGQVAPPEWWDQASVLGIERLPLDGRRDPGFVAAPVAHPAEAPARPARSRRQKTS
jgi:hypothetical protein